MLKREIKINFKSFIIWLASTISLFLVVYLIYPSIMTSENLELLDQMMTNFPEEMLKAFNMDISSISSAFGWLKTEGFVFLLLIVGIYSGALGSTILLKEENDKTIEYLNSLPITRKNIISNKIICALFYIIVFIIFTGLFNYIGLELSGDFDRKLYIMLSITPVFPSVVIFSLCLFISTFTHKTKNTIGISIGLVIASYFLNVISEIGKNSEFLKYLSIFTLADIRNVITNISINPLTVIISIIISVILILLAMIRYEKKELI